LAYTLEELLAVGLPPAMECLIKAIDRRDTVSYADVARYITKRAGKRFARCWHHVGNVLGSVMDRVLEVAPNAPPINTLVVKAGGLPGSGAGLYIERHLHQGCRKLNEDQQRVIIERLHESVWSFDEWRKIGKKAFGTQFVPHPPVQRETESLGG
jgi:hypothetical protein